MKRVQRYQWEDSLIKAETLGLLPAGAVNLGLRLSHAITWEPKNNKPSGLYWKNEDALADVNASRATYYRYRAVLFETGFFEEVAGNLMPLLPDLSQYETDVSQSETSQSQSETAESQFDNPYTVDIYTVDSFTVDEDNVEAADASSTSLGDEGLGEGAQPCLSSHGEAGVGILSNQSVTASRQSQSETREEIAQKAIQRYKELRRLPA